MSSYSSWFFSCFLDVNSGLVQTYKESRIIVRIEVHQVQVEDVVQQLSVLRKLNVALGVLVSPSLVVNGIRDHICSCIVLCGKSLALGLSIDDINIHLSFALVHRYLGLNHSLVLHSFHCVLLLVYYLGLNYCVLI